MEGLSEAAAWRSGSDVEGDPHAFAVDVTDFAAIIEAIRKTEATLAPVDHLVHAAAAVPQVRLRFHEPNARRLAPVLDVNVMGMVNIAHAVVPGMIVPGLAR